ncbi:DNA alkylation repair protein [Rickettsiales endosymbiont of Stachyamoeba lipophora]|uniref:DNA alkylation repair protein n=1 Tax=Rickettsiales endosymbiont of Stachyamoeba lipophora TaxID=2486578 RepID=UPI000F64B83C|nr:DNA alkylation repair protein [Rickettsiales endosymbiont of Stachyamoeba lipophora]AZL15058.1 DNA alkylation repair protein [Rickettsiales endosymbiont of Stachyamoeba lipophora]
MKIDSERLNLLNIGSIESKNLMEGLSVDLNILLSNNLPDHQTIIFPEKMGITKKMRLVAESLYHRYGFKIFDHLLVQRSDTLRGIACFVLGGHSTLLAEKLNLIKPLADDNHFGVREWAWMALRENIAQELGESLKMLEFWAEEGSEKIRRFASEATRPRGVWCAHIRELRAKPWLALNILEALHNDSAKYVQLSVANWLNDAGKDHPVWVSQLCLQWQQISNTEHTKKICKRALRNIKFPA